ncbi:MAG: SPFH domain-containing protein [Candidatus Pseudobacter hemicellulosilyticus]|uniref:SPFH domain-containing protein n=1 Tax=Candidatus Pseudobacter hemicellulosilyticus TaxID=3121375 RepID=A0AAJ5WWC5_9BACT|nr:MAG: SPFH domain-containing protein [Pseudobacter sp.]
MKLPFIEIISWLEHNPNILMWKFPDQDAEIKNGARLIVRESEQALFLNEGKLADQFGPGTHTLQTENIPLLTRLKGWKHGFESPFKADVYFFSTKQFVNLKWGTTAPIMMRDAQFGQVRIRAFGTYNIRIKDIEKFFREYAGTYPIFPVYDLQVQLRDYIAPRFGEVLSNAQIPVLDVAGNLDKVNQQIRPLIAPYFEALGIEVTEFVVSSVTLPEEVLQHFDKVTNMNMVTHMDKFTRFSTANAIGEKGSALNEATQQGAAMAAMLQAAQARPQEATPATSPADSVEARLKKLKQLFQDELIDETEYKAKKAALLDKL